MAEHLFLTGEKGVGRSTLIQAVLADYPGRVGGFLTVKGQGGDTVHLLPVGQRAVPTEENLLFVCRGAAADAAGRFDALGCEAISRCEGCSLVVMDELGPKEAAAALFRSAVLERLEGQIPVLGVLQAPAQQFWPEVVSHPKVTLLVVTRDGRDEVRRRIRSGIGL